MEARPRRRRGVRAAPLYLDDSSDIWLLEIRAKARRLHSQMKPVRRPGPDHRRLPAAHAAGRPHREPRRAGRPDAPRPEDPRRASSRCRSSRCPSSRAAWSRAPTSGRCSRTCASRVTGDTLVAAGRRAARSASASSWAATPEVLCVDDFDRSRAGPKRLRLAGGAPPILEVALGIRADAALHRRSPNPHWTGLGNGSASCRPAPASRSRGSSPSRGGSDALARRSRRSAGSTDRRRQLPQGSADALHDRVGGEQRRRRGAATREFGARVNALRRPPSWHQLLICRQRQSLARRPA